MKDAQDSKPLPATEAAAGTTSAVELGRAEADAARAAALDPATAAREPETVDIRTDDKVALAANPALAGVTGAASAIAAPAAAPRVEIAAKTDPYERADTAPLSPAQSRAAFLTTALPFGWKGMLAFGILTALGGIAAILSPFLASLTVAAFAAATFVILGAATAWMAFKGDAHVVPHRALNGALGALMIVFGVLLFANPLAGLLSLTVLVASFFVAEGAMRLWLGFRMKGRSGWVWLALGGAISLALGVMVFLGLPAASLVVLGLFLGVDLLGTGIAMIALSAAERRATGDKALEPDPRFT